LKDSSEIFHLFVKVDGMGWNGMQWDRQERIERNAIGMDGMGWGGTGRTYDMYWLSQSFHCFKVNFSQIKHF